MLRIRCNDTTFGDIFYHEKGRGFDDWPEEFNQEVNKKRKLSELANEEIIGPMSGPTTEELNQLYHDYILRRQANGYRTHVDYWTWLASRQRPGARERRARRAEREAREAAAAERTLVMILRSVDYALTESLQGLNECIITRVHGLKP